MGARLNHLRSFFLAIVALSLFAPVFNSTALAGVNDQFGRALQQFDRGQYSVSQKTLKKILKKYSNHGPSLFLMGRIQLRADNPARAVQYFRQSGRDYAEGDGAMDYGVAHYQVKDFREAIIGFAQVRDRNTRDLASFYQGMSYYRLGDYPNADRQLVAARNLPEGKAETRDRVLNDIHGKMSQGIYTGPSDAIAPPPPVAVAPPVTSYPPPQGYGPQTQQGPAGPSGPTGTGGEKPKEKPSKPKIGTRNAVTPRLGAYRSDETAIYSGAQKEESSTTGYLVGVLDTVSNYLKPEKGGAQTIFSLGIDVAYVMETVDGRKVKYYASAGDQENLFYGDETRSNASGNRGELKLIPGVKTPLGKSTTGSASFEYFDKYPDLKGDKASGSRTPGAGIATTVGTTALTFDGKYKINTSAGETIRNDIIATGGVTPAWTAVTLEGKIGYKISDDPRGLPLEGPKTALSLDVTISKLLDFGVKPYVAFGYAQLGQYSIGGLTQASTTPSSTTSPPPTTTGSGGATATTFTGVAEATRKKEVFGMDVSPLDWITGSISLTLQQTDYVVSDDALAASFLFAAPSSTSAYSLSLTVSKALE